MSVEKRRAVENYVLQHVTTMDPSGFNTQRYQTMFTDMSDEMFDHWMGMIKSGQTRLYLYAPNMKVTLSVPNLLQAARDIKLQLFERIRLWDPVTKRYYLTPHPYLILKLPVRRLKQYLMDKISVPDSDRVTNPTTGQVSKPDKGSAISMTEAQTLDSKGLHKSLTELTNVRGGNQVAYANLRSNLEETGQSSLAEIDTSGGIRSAVVASVLLESLHLENNL